MTRWARLLPAGLLCALVLWMLLDRSVQQKRAEGVEAALRSGQLAYPGDADPERVRRQVSQLLAASGVVDHRMHEPPSPDRLDVYISTPAARKITRVDEGNAGYDPIIDAIFIDQSFIDHSVYLDLCRGSSFGILGCRDYYPSLDVFFAFVFLHELGHRELHRGRSLVDLAGSGEERGRHFEREADRYALQMLKRAYELDLPITRRDEKADLLRETLGLDRKLLPSETMWADLVASFVISIMLNGFLGGPYSPFYADQSHPSFVARSAGLVESILRDEDLPDLFRPNFEFFLDLLDRHASIPKERMVEFRTDEPIVDVSFSDDALLVLSGRGRRFWNVPLDTLFVGGLPVQKGQAVGGPTPCASTEVTWPSGWVHAENDVFWSMGDGQLLVVDAFGEESHRWTGSSWQSASFEIDTHHCFDLWVGASPSSYALAKTCPDVLGEPVDRLFGVKDGRILSTKLLSDLESTVRRQLSDDSSHVQLLKSGDRLPSVTVNGRYVSLIVYSSCGDGSECFTGVIVVDLATMDVVSALKLALPESHREVTETREVVAFPAEKGGRLSIDVYFVSEVGRDSTAEGSASSWGVWRYRDGDLIPLATQDFLGTGFVSSDLASQFEPAVQSAFSIDGSSLVVNFEGDSIYLVDLKAGRIETLFALGGVTHRFAISRAGHLALFFPGGKKVYVFEDREFAGSRRE